ncbi:hypothetical protein KDW_59430 [Dictyobacter vulcani]|uniref:DUF4097 domain-containing protein n=1 Tax=Dictyobacter vulcani TaxID=2607529 RepID=A0A5J4KZ85_9CHLR|nr:DUF4097 family beta strand repeat-containing protein [Dictyobacter vulcani]GER91781.1 hypothetical protein KDW_59430 [Dictyobacter vulcani]
MSQQQSQFHEDGPPVGQYEQPPLQREVNHDPREQPDYSQGYHYDPHTQGEKLRPMSVRPRRRSRRGLWIAVVLGVMFLGVMFLGGALGYHNYSSRLSPHSEAPSYVTEFKGTTVNLHATSADIHVHFGTSNVVRVSSIGSDTFKGDTDGTTITLNEVDQRGGLFEHRNQTIDITAPADEHLILQTKSGNVEIDNIAAQANVNTDSGDITVDQARFENGSSLQTKSGDIHFKGNLAEKGTYAFTTDSGNVDVGLLASTPAKVTAHTVNGQVSQAPSGPTTASSPDLTINTNTGDIKLEYTD